ncbi:MAG: oligopeptide transporter, OPT family [Legionella sp.]|nr:oligopeptide transporter, OPT family [Legionella sp.]
MNDTPLIPAEKSVAELSFRVFLLAILLTMLLAMSNAYLALKLGILTSASIPAAIISMGILRFFKKPTLLENNAVQTAASAGEAVAGGIVYTIPALIIIGFWNHFDYWTNFLIALCGGVLGVLFSIPLRKILVHDAALKFPEGRAIAEVLKTSTEKTGVEDIFIGGAIGAVFELFQIGFKIIANSWGYWFVFKRSLFGIGAGFSATMMGAGYLVGHDMAISIFIGAIISWLLALPIISQFYPEFLVQYPPEKAATLLWNSELRYLGIGAMLFAGVWTFIKLIKPLAKNINISLRMYKISKSIKTIPRTDRDIPFPFILLGTILITAVLYILFRFILPTTQVGLDSHSSQILIVFCLMYVLVIGFIFSVITAFFSGMVGVTASPGSSVVISGMLFAAWLLLSFVDRMLPLPLSIAQLQAAEAITIIIGSVVTGIAAIANDNTQDLKVGQLVGATPWKQQVMLLLGVLISSLVIPPVMQLLFDVYGIAGVMPHAGMDISQSLPAPTAALMAAITEAVFRNSLPWVMMLVGFAIISIALILNRILKIHRYFNLSILGIAIGMYLSLATSFPLFIGGMIALFVQIRLKKISKSPEDTINRKQKGTLTACGLVAGSAIMDVILAIPFSIFHTPDALQLVSEGWKTTSIFLAIISMVCLAWWINHRVCKKSL